MPGGAEPLLPGLYEAMGRNWGKKMPPSSKILPLGLARVSSKEVLFLFFSCLLALPLGVPKCCSKAAPCRSGMGWDGTGWEGMEEPGALVLVTFTPWLRAPGISLGWHQAAPDGFRVKGAPWL